MADAQFVEKTPAVNTRDLLALARLLYQQKEINSDAGKRGSEAEVMSQNLTDRSNFTNSVTDTYLALVNALKDQVSADPEKDLEFLKNRSAQVNSSMMGAIDRAGATAMSQGFAKSLRRGMGDSTQAEDLATNLSRKLADLYARANDSAQQRAFDELNKNRTTANQALSVASQGLVGLNRDALTNARQLQEASSRAASTANQAVGKNVNDLVSSPLVTKLGDRLLAAGDRALTGFAEKGFDALLRSMSSGGGKAATPSPPLTTGDFARLDRGQWEDSSPGGMFFEEAIDLTPKEEDYGWANTGDDTYYDELEEPPMGLTADTNYYDEFEEPPMGLTADTNDDWGLGDWDWEWDWGWD